VRTIRIFTVIGTSVPDLQANPQVPISKSLYELFELHPTETVEVMGDCLRHGYSVVSVSQTRARGSRHSVGVRDAQIASQTIAYGKFTCPLIDEA